MILSERIGHVLERRFGVSLRRARAFECCGQTLRLVGTSFNHADYDDAWLVALSSEARAVLDLGCNVGLSSLLMLRFGQALEVLLVDANDKALTLAAENLIMNQAASRARFVRRFVADVPDQEMPFYTVGSGAAGSMHANHAVSASAIGVCVKVPTTTVDALVVETPFTPELIKVDVEGAESLVLAGAVNTAKSMRCRFFVEMHSSVDRPMLRNAERILRWCQDVGYQAWYLKQHARLEAPETIAQRGRCHLLLLPQEQAFPSYLNTIEQGAPIADAVEAVARARKTS